MIGRGRPMQRRSEDARADAARRVNAELEHHVALTTEELVAAGLDRASARREAERRFGDRRAHAEACVAVWEKRHRAARRRQIVRGIGGDLRYATRGLRKNPGFAAVVVATLVLGIGANTAVFSLVRGVLLRPLPYPDPDRLVWIYTSSPPQEWPFSVADFLALEEQQTSFERVGAFMTRGVTFNADQIAERVLARYVTADFFATLSRPLARGRGFTRAEGRPGAELTVVVSHGFWQRYLGARADVLGQRIRLDARDYAIIGVLPPEVGPLEERAEVFPILQLEPPPRKGPFFLRVVGRRTAGVGAEIAAAELRGINERIFPVWQASYQDSRATWGSKPLRESLVQNARDTLFVLLGAVALVLLVACTNVANLMLTRAAERQGEIAVRRALGATFTRLARQLLVEALLVAVIGGLGGSPSPPRRSRRCGGGGRTTSPDWRKCSWTAGCWCSPWPSPWVAASSWARRPPWWQGGPNGPRRWRRPGRASPRAAGARGSGGCSSSCSSPWWCRCCSARVCWFVA